LIGIGKVIHFIVAALLLKVQDILLGTMLVLVQPHVD